MLHSTAERFRWTNLPSDPLQDWTASCTTQNTVPVRIITTFMRQCVWQQWDICTIRAFRQIHPMHAYIWIPVDLLGYTASRQLTVARTELESDFFC
jgi:hypothetical protein